MSFLFNGVTFRFNHIFQGCRFQKKTLGHILDAFHAKQQKTWVSNVTSPNHWFLMVRKIFRVGGFNPTHSKNMPVKLDHFPRFGVKMKKVETTQLVFLMMPCFSPTEPMGSTREASHLMVQSRTWCANIVNGPKPLGSFKSSCFTSSSLSSHKKSRWRRFPFRVMNGWA